MSVEGVRISGATREDLEEILSLLDAVGLPREGVAEHLEGFLVARDGGGRLAGCIGVERHGGVGLLRSAAVSPERQHSGLGSRLTSALLERVAAEGLEEVVLLTETARDFFARKFAFEETSRDVYEETFARSTEWHLPRCSTAAPLRLRLKRPELGGNLQREE